MIQPVLDSDPIVMNAELGFESDPETINKHMIAFHTRMLGAHLGALARIAREVDELRESQSQD